MPLGGHAPVGRRHQLRSGHERGGKANQSDREDDAEYGAQVYRHLADVRCVDRDDNRGSGTEVRPEERRREQREQAQQRPSAGCPLP